MYKKQQEKVSTLEAALRNAQRAQEEYASRVSTAQSNIERCERALETLWRSTGNTTAEQEELTKELDKWNAELEEAQAGQSAAERGVQNWQKQLNNAKVELNGLSNEIDKNNGYLDEARNSADGCADSIDEFGNEVDESKKGVEGQSHREVRKISPLLSQRTGTEGVGNVPILCLDRSYCQPEGTADHPHPQGFRQAAQVICGYYKGRTGAPDSVWW